MEHEMPLRVLYLTSGGSIHDRRFLAKLAERGYCTCHAYLDPSGRNDVDPSWTSVTSCHLGSSAKRSRKLGKVVSLFKSYRIFLRLLQSFRPHVVHAGWIQTAGLIAAASRYRPLLLMPWGSDVLVYPRRSKALRAITRYVLRQADIITCDAEAVKREIIHVSGYPAEKIVVFPWGVDLELFHPSVAVRASVRKRLGLEKNKVIIMTRNLYPVYGVEYFIRALPQVFREVPEARALLAGSGPLEQELRSLAAELGISDRVRFLGAIPNHKLPEYLNAADLYVSSSLSDGTSLSLLEALACGLPVVVTDLPANLEWVDHGVNGFVVRRNEVDSLAQAIVRLVCDDDLSLRMRKDNLRKARERADWNKNFRVLEGLYQRLSMSNQGEQCCAGKLWE